MKRSRVLRLAAVIALGACGGDSSETIVLGIAGPFDDGYGRMNLQGAQLAVEEINDAGGVNGRRLELLQRNDSADPQKAVAIAQEFIANPAVVAIVGHVNSGTMMAAARVYDGQMPAVATTASSPQLTGISPWVFRVIPSDSTNGIDLARFAMKLGRRRAAILYENDSYGRGLADAFRQNFKGEIVSLDPISGDDRDFEPFISLYKQRRVDIVFMAGVEGTAKAFLAQGRRMGLEADYLGGDGWTQIVTDTAIAEGAYVGAPFSDADPRPEAQRFTNAFRSRYRATPDGNAALAYDATRLLAQAIEQAGTDRGAVREYLAGLRGGEPYKGVTGEIRFSEHGDPVGKGLIMTRVRGGRLLVEATQ